MSATCPTCGEEVRLAQPWRPSHTPTWAHRTEPADGHRANLPIPPPTKPTEPSWQPEPVPVIVTQRRLHDDELPAKVAARWSRVHPQHRKLANYALALMPDGTKVESVGIRAQHGNRNAVAVWESRDGGEWEPTLCRGWESGTRGSYQRLYVAKMATWINEERQS
jgi:hypothetical protein